MIRIEIPLKPVTVSVLAVLLSLAGRNLATGAVRAELDRAVSGR